MGLSSTSKTQTEYNLSPPQSRFVREDTKRFVGFVSGVGAGKTFAGIARTIRNATQWNPGEMGAIVAPARRMIVDVIIPEMRDLGLFDAPYNWEYKSAYSDEPGIHIPDGGRILMLSADNKRTIERLRGLNLAYWWMDEESDIEPRARQILQQRLRAGEYRNGYVTTTPKGKNHTYEFFAQGIDTVPWDGAGELYEADDRIALVGVPTSANDFLPDDYQTAMQNDMPDEIRAQEVEGRFVEIGSGIFTTDMLTFVQPSDIHEDYTLNYILGVDPASKAENAASDDSDYWAATLAAVHRRTGQLWAVDTKRERGMTLKQGVSWVSDIAGQVPSPTLAVESNQSQRWLRQELADQGFNTMNVQSSRNKEERLMDLSIPLENDVVQFVNHEIDQSLDYDPRWQPLIDELLAFPDGSHDDLIDSLHLCVDNAQLSTGSILSADPYGRDN
jgi:predicted phage terminase large subunit-like protein